MITFGFIDLLILFGGWGFLFMFLPDWMKEEIGQVIGIMFLLAWLVLWIVVFPVMHYHVALTFVRL